MNRDHLRGAISEEDCGWEPSCGDGCMGCPECVGDNDDEEETDTVAPFDGYDGDVNVCDEAKPVFCGELSDEVVERGDNMAGRVCSDEDAEAFEEVFSMSPRDLNGETLN